MGEINDRLGGRTPGELVRSADWNALVAEVDRIDALVSESFSTLGARIGEVEDQLAAVREDHIVMQAAVNGLAARHLDLRLATARATYAIGERAEVTAQVATLGGAPVPDPRPFVDFVTVWGRLQPAAGSAGVVGADGRSLSVQVDASGVARAQLVADATEDLPLDIQIGFEAAIQTQVATSQRTFAQTVLNASTPAEAVDLGAFALMTNAYERASEPHVRSYLDAYHVRTPVRTTVTTLPVITTQWRDYRATVLAVVKPDTNPTTPDAALGTASLQVTFRDWLGPWIVLDYLDVFQSPDIVVIRDDLFDSLATTLPDSLAAVTDKIATLVEDRGALGRARTLQLVDLALGDLDAAGVTPAFADVLANTVQQAVRVQQTLEPAQAAIATQVGRQPGVEAFAQAAAASTAGLGTLTTSVDTVQRELDRLDLADKQASEELEQIQRTVSNLDGKVTVAVDRDFNRLDNKVADLASQVDEVERLYPEPVKETLIEFHSKLLKVDQLERAVDELRR
jgi:hypothetical protein